MSLNAEGAAAAMSKGRILVIRGGAIGDFILTLPAIAALRTRFPEARLELLGYPHITQLARAGGWVDGLRAIEAKGLAGFFARHGDLDADISAYFESFDLIISYLFDPDGIFGGNLAACTDAQVIHGPHRPDESGDLHATQVYLKPLERLAIFDADPVPRISLERSEGRPADLVLHPGSGSDEKNWPESRWEHLFEQLISITDQRLLVVGGEAEGDRLDRLTASIPGERVEFARSLPLAELAARMTGCGGFVGHDSGITHLAAALGLSCVVLWPTTNEAIWKPQGERITVLREPRGLRALDVNWVLREVQKLLG